MTPNSQNQYDEDVPEMPVLVAVEGWNFYRFLKTYLEEAKEFKTSVEAWNYSEIRGKKIKQVSIEDGLRNLLKKGSFKSTVKALGIIRDAETNRTKATSEIRAALKALNLAVPDAEGKIEQKDDLCVGYMVMPKSTETGCIETDGHKCSTLDARIISHINVFHDAVQKDFSSKFTENYSAKFKFNAMIAASDRPDATYADSVRFKLWNFDASPLSEIRDFLRLLRDSIPKSDPPIS